MSQPKSTFSESWYRIAGQRISLRSAVNVQRQVYRGQRWIVLENPFTNQFYRMHPAAYEFVARLRPERTVQEVWQECIERSPDDAPGQEAVIQLLAQLYFANLLQYDLATDTANLFERYEKNRQREIRSRFSNIMFTRIRLLDPDEFLVKLLPYLGWLISPIGALLWFLVVGAGFKMAFDNWAALKDQSQGVLEANNLLLLYLGLVIIKSLHEFGHALFCRRYGGEVHVMGVMFMIFTPVPYMDATSSWAFRSRWQRALVGGAGMIVELLVAAVAVFIWSRTGPGVLHNLAYNMMFVASVSTVLFNINPLLRYDGYYILIDLIEMPNLYQRSLQHLRHLVERYAFGVKNSQSPAQSKREVVWFTLYGILGGIYRVIVFTSVIFFVADRMLLLGIIMAVVCVISWGIVPVAGFCQYLASSEKLERSRNQAIAVTLATLAVVILCLGVIPFPNHFRAVGMLEAKHWSEVVNNTAGRLEKISASPGSVVKQGQELLRFNNPELELELTGARASLVEVQARLLYAMKDDPANIRPLNAKLDSVQKRLLRLETDKAALVVRARQDGVWVAPQIKDFVGRWIIKGTSTGIIVDPSSFEFNSAVLQEDVDRLFALKALNGEVRLQGQVNRVLPLKNLKVIPGEQRYLPSAAMGWLAGGDIPVANDDPKGRQALEPFFEVRADVVDPGKDLVLMHGQTGKIRFDLPAEPLLVRWLRSLRQSLQKRYQI